MKEFVEKVNEAFKFLNEDLIYVAMVGIVDINDEEIQTYVKEDVEDQSFDHWYEWSEMMSECTARGEALIPLYDDMYMKFEFNS